MALAENEGGSKVEAKAEEAKTKAVVAARVGNLEVIRTQNEDKFVSRRVDT